MLVIVTKLCVSSIKQPYEQTYRHRHSNNGAPNAIPTWIFCATIVNMFCFRINTNRVITKYIAPRLGALFCLMNKFVGRKFSNYCCSSATISVHKKFTWHNHYVWYLDEMLLVFTHQTSQRRYKFSAMYCRFPPLHISSLNTQLVTITMK